jgi:hypothetical protein
MAKTHDSNSDKLNVLVFKDNYSSRSFQIPLTWISRLGLYVFGLALVTAASSFFAIKSHLALRSTNPERVRDLEHQLSELQAKLSSSPAQAIANAPSIPQPGASAGPITIAGTKHVAQVPQPASSLPFTIQQLSTFWRGNALRVRFAIQYTKGDGGNQQGHIVIFARGPNMTLTYPEHVLAKVDSPALIRPEEGEYFSVSRYREVNADFPPVVNRGTLTEAEIMLFDNNNQLLILERIPIKNEARTAAPAAAEAPMPTVSSSAEQKP